MKIFVVFLCLLLGGCVTTNSADGRIRIVNNRGGNVMEFALQTIIWKEEKKKVIVDGNCYSACTMYLALPTLCATKRAKFHFHSPTIDGKLVSKERLKKYMNFYPKRIQQWIYSKGGLTKDWIVLKGEEMKRLVPQCVS